MQKKIETLEKLVYQACRQISELEKENKSLASRLKAADSKFNEFSHDKQELSKLLNWKKKAHQRLKKLKTKIESAIDQTK